MRCDVQRRLRILRSAAEEAVMDGMLAVSGGRLSRQACRCDQRGKQDNAELRETAMHFTKAHGSLLAAPGPSGAATRILSISRPPSRRRT